MLETNRPKITLTADRFATIHQELRQWPLVIERRAASTTEKDRRQIPVDPNIVYSFEIRYNENRSAEVP